MRKKIAILFLLIVSMSFCNQILIAATNPDYPTAIKGDDGTWVSKVVSVVGKTLLNPLSALACCILLIFEGVLNAAFGQIANHSFPYADSIIFNAVPILDVNFMNPTAGSTVTTTISSVVKGMYGTLWGLSAAFFSFALFFIGIKLATESIAHKKAKYKEALMSWLVGLIMLFLIHFGISFMFSLNEELVNMASKIAVEGVQEGQVTSIAVKYRNHMIKDHPSFTGITTGFIAFDFTNIVLFGVLLGQSLIVLFAYFKRLFYVTILSLLAPVMVMVNTYQKTLVGKGQALPSLLKELFSAVLQQALQAVIFAIIVRILNFGSDQTIGYDNAGAALGIIQAAGIISALKMTELIEKVMGWSNGMHGGLGAGVKTALTALAVGRMGMKAAKNIGDNVGKWQKGGKQRAAAEKEYERARERYEADKELYGQNTGGEWQPPESFNDKNEIKEIASKTTVENEDEKENSGKRKNMDDISRMASAQQVTADQLAKLAQLIASQKTGVNAMAAMPGNPAGIIFGSDGQPISAGKQISIANGNSTLIGSAPIGARGAASREDLNSPVAKQLAGGPTPTGEGYTTATSSKAGPKVTYKEDGAYLTDMSEKDNQKAISMKRQALISKQNMEKAEEAHSRALKEATQLRRQAVGGTIGGLTGGIVAASVAAGSGDVTKILGGGALGLSAGDAIGEQIGKSKAGAIPGGIARAIDSNTQYVVSDSINKIQNYAETNIKSKMRKATGQLVENMAENNMMAVKDASSIVETLQKKTKTATSSLNRKNKEHAKNTGKKEYVEHDVSNLL